MGNTLFYAVRDDLEFTVNFRASCVGMNRHEFMLIEVLSLRVVDII